MKIETLIEQLTELKNNGTELVSVIDSNWNDMEIESIATESSGKLALIMVSIEEDYE